mgnify:FL=1
MEQRQKSSKIRKRAEEIVCSLLTEGYVLTYQSQGCLIVSLRHKVNGNHVVVKCGALGVYVYKNKKLVKSEEL